MSNILILRMHKENRAQKKTTQNVSSSGDFVDRSSEVMCHVRQQTVTKRAINISIASLKLVNLPRLTVH